MTILLFRKMQIIGGMMKKDKVGHILFTLIWLVLLNQSLEGQKILFKSNFTDLKTTWAIWDDPSASGGVKESLWKAGLAELSGIKNKDSKLATVLLAGETSWKDYAVETTILNDGSRGYLTGIVFGYQDQEHYYHAGYNFELTRFELEACTPEGFVPLASYKIVYPKQKFIPIRLEFAGNRIRILANQKPVIDVTDSLYPSGRFGIGTSNLGNGRVLFGPVMVKSIDPASLPAPEMEDLLAGIRGAKVISEAFQRDFSRLIDHEGSLTGEMKPDRSNLYLNLSKETLPIEAVFAFPQEKEAEIHKIKLQLTSGKFPGQVEFLVSNEPAAGFQSLGIFEIKPEKNNIQDLPIQPAKARFLKLRILSITEQTYKTLEIKELYVYGYDPDKKGMTTQPSAASDAGEVLFQDDFSSGLSGHWEVWDDSNASPNRSRWDVALTEYSGITNPLKAPATLLTAGEGSWTNYSVKTRFFAESSMGNLTGVVFGYRDPEHYYIAGYNFSKNGYELKVKTPHGFETLALAEMHIPRREFVPFRVDFMANRILFRAGGRLIFDLDDGLYSSGQVGIGTSAQGIGILMFKGFEVVELTPGAAPPRELQDLLSGKRGATVIYRPSPPKSEPFAQAIDHSLEDPKNLGSQYNLDLSRSVLPEEAVFCFPQGRFVEIHRIGVKLLHTRFPKEIKFWVSDQTPKTGFTPLTTIMLEAKPDSYQEFKVPPTRTKYLKVQITAAHDPKSLDIADMFVKGYFMEKSSHRSERETFEETELREEEGNNTVTEAQWLPLNQALRGEAEGDDIDYYKIALREQAGNTLSLQIDSADIVRPVYELQTKKGTLVKPSFESSTGTQIMVRYQLQPDDYYLKVWRPDAFLAVVYDDSGSMHASVKTVKRVLKGYLDRLGKGLNIKLMKYTDKVDDLSDFTHDPAELKEAIEKQVKGGGGTDTYKGLRTAVQSVMNKQGSRAVLGIFDVVDCSGSECLKKYLDLWDSVLDSGVSFNTIAVQTGWDRKTPYFYNTREQIFKEIAYASQGQFYHSPFDEQIAQNADQIFRQLTSPSVYRIKADWTLTEKKPGSVEVQFEKGAERKAAKNVELILDSSNSMWGQIQGKAKIVIAKKVLNEIINGLPDGMNVGLRLYGHRYKLNDSRACGDTELVASIGPIDKEQVIAAVNKIQPKGKTPLVHAVLEAIKDFQDLKAGTIVLISDGVESCDGDITSIPPALKKAGLDLKVNIVGFDIKEAEARRQLEGIAESTGGIYLDAKDSRGLLASLEQTLKVEFVLMDEKGDIKARGVVGGGPVQVLEGTYTLELLLRPESLEMSITVSPNKKSKLTLKKDSGKWKLVL
jgi:hypothetical protein